MDHSLEWLFDEVYKIRRKTPDVKLYFPSDWDGEGQESDSLQNILSSVYRKAGTDSYKYNYSYEQFSIREQILGLLAQHSGPRLMESNVSITPNATVSLLLMIQSFRALGYKRILVFTPAYFASHESLKNASIEVFYYHLRDSNNYSVDYDLLRRIMEEQHIDGVLLTDPVYSAGIEFSEQDYENLARVCSETGSYLLIDYSLGGLYWQTKTSYLINRQKLAILQGLKMFAFVESLPKRLMLNGIKFSVIFGDEQIIDKIDLQAESTYGGLGSAQCYLIRELYNNEEIIYSICEENLARLKNNYTLIQALLSNTDFSLSPTNSGYFTLINHNHLSLQEVGIKNIVLMLLREKQILSLTKDRFTYYPDNKFGFRINLAKPGNELLFPISQMVGVNYKGFDK